MNEHTTQVVESISLGRRQFLVYCSDCGYGPNLPVFQTNKEASERRARVHAERFAGSSERVDHKIYKVEP